jgi:hypothetical protein
LCDQARYSLKRLPRSKDVLAAHNAIRRDLRTEPLIEHRVDLVCVMLDALNVKASDSYIQMLAWKLGDCPQPRRTETLRRHERWFSMAAITRAIDEVVTTIRPEYGAPVPIAVALDVAGRHASELIRLDWSIVVLGNTIDRLKRIVDATEDAPEPRFSDDDDRDDLPF